MKPGWKTFVHGQVYRLEEFVSQTWGPDHQRTAALSPETLFRYHKPPGDTTATSRRSFEPENALVQPEPAQKAVEELRGRGMTYRQIARLGGVSIEAVHRSATGVGRIRQSTETALLRSPTRSRTGTAARAEGTPCQRGWSGGRVGCRYLLLGSAALQTAPLHATVSGASRLISS